MWPENVLLPEQCVCVFVLNERVCVCLKGGSVGVGREGGGVLALPQQQPQLCNIICCGVNKAMCTRCLFIPAVEDTRKQTCCSSQLNSNLPLHTRVGK